MFQGKQAGIHAAIRRVFTSLEDDDNGDVITNIIRPEDLISTTDSEVYSIISFFSRS